MAYPHPGESGNTNYRPGRRNRWTHDGGATFFCSALRANRLIRDRVCGVPLRLAPTHLVRLDGSGRRANSAWPRLVRRVAVPA